MRVASIVFISPLDNINSFAEACLRFSPQLCLKRLGTIFVEIGKCSKLYREETFLARLKILLRRFDIRANVAIGNTILEATLLANYGTLDHADLPIDCFLDCYDVYRTDRDAPKMVEKITDGLKRVGVKTVQEFLSLPAAELPSRFGAAGLIIRDRLLGEMDCGWPLWIPEEKIKERVELFDGERCNEVEPLLFHLKPLLDRAFSRLWSRGLRAESILFRLSLEKSSAVSDPYPEFPLEFQLPQTTVKGTLPIVRDRLNRDLSRRPLRAAVIAIDLEILKFARNYQGQRHFFHNREETDAAFSTAVNQLVERLGKENVFRANIHDDAVAELSWSKTFTDQTNPPDLSDYIPERPLRVLPKPIQVQITNEMFHFRSRCKKILEWSPVEEISTYRIDQEFVRSYYRLRLEGRSMEPWVFKCPKGFYWLHGWFG